MYLFTDDILQEDKNIIYTFDNFNPDKFVFNEDVDRYPGTFKCNRLYKGYVSQNCPGGNGNVDMTFDKNWNEENIKKWVVSFKERNNVPVYMNQWNAVHGIKTEEGREQYIEDISEICQRYNIGWGWWTFRGGN